MRSTSADLQAVVFPICSIHQPDTGTRVFQHFGFLGEEVIVLQSIGMIGAGQSIQQVTTMATLFLVSIFELFLRSEGLSCNPPLIHHHSTS